MADFSSLFEQAGKLASAAAKVVPAIEDGVEIGKKVLELIDFLGAKAPQADQTELREARRELRTAVSAKAQATATRLDG